MIRNRFAEGLLLLVILVFPKVAFTQERDSGPLTAINEATCPFELLKGAYLDIADESPSVLDVYAVEKEVLLLCRERQELLLTIADNDQRLRMNMNIEDSSPRNLKWQEFEIHTGLECEPPSASGAEKEELAKETEPDENTSDPLETGEGIDTIGLEVELASSDPPAETRVVDVSWLEPFITQFVQSGMEHCLPPLDYQLHSIMRLGSDWQARLRTMEGETLRVRLGDTLPDGRIVTEIDRTGLVVSDNRGNNEHLSLPPGRISQSESPTHDHDVSEVAMSDPVSVMEDNPTIGDGTMDVILPNGSWETER